jgi:hypothetical protein
MMDLAEAKRILAALGREGVEYVVVGKAPIFPGRYPTFGDMMTRERNAGLFLPPADAGLCPVLGQSRPPSNAGK